jgi:hypothetical protein
MAHQSNERPVVAVRVCVDDKEADVVMALLRDRGIESFPSSQLSHRVLPVAAGALGEVTIYVDEAVAEKAIKTIKKAGGDA